MHGLMATPMFVKMYLSFERHEMVGTGGKPGFKMLDAGRQEIYGPHKQLKDSCSK